MFTWPFIPQRIHTEALEWKTDVIRTKSSEKRFVLRSAPRSFYEYDYIMDERQFSRAKLIVQDGEDIYLPIWGEHTKITSILSGAESLSFDTSYATYAVNGQAIIWSTDDTFEVITIDTLTPTGITWTGGLENSYQKVFIVPMKTCKFTSSLKTTRYAKTYSKTSVGFVTTEVEDLSEDSITSLVGEVLSITNPEAELGLTGWTIISGNWTAENTATASPSGGYYFIPDSSGSSGGVLRQTLSLIIGEMTTIVIDSGKASISILWEQNLGFGTSQDSGNIRLIFLNEGNAAIASVSSPSKDFSSSGWETISFSTVLNV